MKAAIVNNTNNVVENVIVWDDTCIAPENKTTIVLEDNHKVGAGFLWTGNTTFVPTEYVETDDDPVYVPPFVSARQARLVLLNAGLLANVEAMIATQDEATKLTWEYATEFRRDDPLLLSLAENLNLTSEEIDNFFIQASGI